jgi:cell division protein ZapA
MPKNLTIEIVGRRYELACDDDQETVLKELAQDIDKRAKSLLEQVGQVGDARLLVMVSLSILEELKQLKLNADNSIPSPQDSGIDKNQIDEVLARHVDKVCQRIESIAEIMNKA